MQNRTPVAASHRAPVPDFTPVPRKFRHDGWTPERQRAFIAALADTGSVSRAAAQVNMAQANCYTLRRAPGAEEFRRAWAAALDFGVARLKDIAFERAIEGQLVPVFVAGKLMGFRRKRNDALLMFCLRHYGEDREGRRTTVNYFSTRASAGAGEGGVGAEASTTTVRTVIAGGGGKGTPDDDAAAVLDRFAGVALDAVAAAEIEAAMQGCAERRRARQAALDAPGDAAMFAHAEEGVADWVHAGGAHPMGLRLGELEPASVGEDFVPFVEGEPHWSDHGAPIADAHLPYVSTRFGGDRPDPSNAGVAAVAKRPSRRGKPVSAGGSGG